MSAQPLTKDQQWDLFACGSRCLLKLAEVYQIQIDRAEFVARYWKLFPPDQQGGLVTSHLLGIAKHMGLGSRATSLRRMDIVRKEFESKRYVGVLVVTERDKDRNGIWGAYFHVRLLMNLDSPDGRWLLWHPDQTGKDFPIPYTEDELNERYAHFLLLH